MEKRILKILGIGVRISANGAIDLLDMGGCAKDCDAGRAGP
jgi:hypothetical protein